MKSTVENKEVKESKVYPYLGVYNGYVVLFSHKNAGTYVNIPEDDTYGDEVGDYTTDLDESLFRKFNGKVILEN